MSSVQQPNKDESKWLDQIGEDDFAGAATTLFEMSRKETNLSKKKTMLSLCKLSALISGNLTTFRDIDYKLDEIESELTECSMNAQ